MNIIVHSYHRKIKSFRFQAMLIHRKIERSVSLPLSYVKLQKSKLRERNVNAHRTFLCIQCKNTYRVYSQLLAVLFQFERTEKVTAATAAA